MPIDSINLLYQYTYIAQEVGWQLWDHMIKFWQADIGVEQQTDLVATVSKYKRICV